MESHLTLNKDASVFCSELFRGLMSVYVFLIDSCFGLKGITASWGVGSEVQRIMGIIYLVPVSRSLPLTSERKTASVDK